MWFIYVNILVNMLVCNLYILRYEFIMLICDLFLLIFELIICKFVLNNYVSVFVWVIIL